ncbi:hypothetical protein NP493_6597g00001 [Ridgeia piscesae]|uniref:Uncharacterized protein n=1 Tax=Ridgeia piscesae TaxID=27915 RepID=A0AAD9IQM1_RIDPI|nr:hypothetical protein NP493_6597g00001 [Ridgeia piscesae]
MLNKHIASDTKDSAPEKKRKKPTTMAQAVIQLDGAVDSTSDDIDIPSVTTHCQH